MVKVAHVENITRNAPSERFPADGEPYQVTDTRIYTCLGDESLYVCTPHQLEHGWPDLEEINECDFMIYHGGPACHDLTVDEIPLCELLTLFRCPVFLSFEPGNYDSFCARPENILHNLRVAFAQPNVVGVMLQVPYHYRALSRILGKTCFVPPPTVVHKHPTWDCERPRSERAGFYSPRSLLECVGGGGDSRRYGHLSAMVASDAAKHYGEFVESRMGATYFTYGHTQRSGVITDQEVAHAFGVENYRNVGMVRPPVQSDIKPVYLDKLAGYRVVVNLDASGAWGRISYEGVLMGVPAVVSNRLFSSLVFPYTTVDPMDLRSAEAHVHRLMTDDAFHDEVVEIGKRRTKRMCDPENVTDRMLWYVRRAGL